MSTWLPGWVIVTKHGKCGTHLSHVFNEGIVCAHVCELYAYNPSLAWRSPPRLLACLGLFGHAKLLQHAGVGVVQASGDVELVALLGHPLLREPKSITQTLR